MGLVQIATSIVLDDADAWTLIKALESAGDKDAESAAARITVSVHTPGGEPISFSYDERQALLRAIDSAFTRPLQDTLTP